MATMSVKIFAGKVVVDPSTETLPVGTPPTELVWEPDLATDTIEFIGFDDPTGAGFAISTPQPEGGTKGPGVKWKSTDNNPAPKIFSYHVYVRRGGVVFSSDPQIVNEGQGGGGGTEDKEPPVGGRPGTGKRPGKPRPGDKQGGKKKR